MTTFSATVAEDGSVQIPAEHLLELGWVMGDNIAFNQTEKGWVLMRIDADEA